MVSTKLAIVTPLADMNMVSTITDDILAVDAGVLQVLNHPRLIGAIGDFDSMDQHDYSMVRSIPVPLVKLNVKKDITDLDAALAYGFDQGYQWVDVYGAIGKRIDHSYANILLLSRYGDHVRYVMENGDMVVKQTDMVLPCDKYDRFSLFAMQQSCISIQDALYPLDHHQLNTMDPLCISNQWLNHRPALISIHYGKLLVIRIKENPIYHSIMQKGDNSI